MLPDLPEAAYVLAPELREVDLTEPAATCHRCVMSAEHSGEDPALPWVFDIDLRCCTYHPRLAGYLAGRALREGGASAAAIRARIDTDEAVTSLGLFTPEAYREKYKEYASGSFGRDPSLRCPYWAGGEQACAIWRNRPAVCRTWSCRFQHGEVGHERAEAVHELLGRIENLLAACCIAGQRPPRSGAETATWESWYRWCADFVDALTPEQLAPLASQGGLAESRERLRELLGATLGELPDVVVAAVQHVIPVGERVRISGFHSYAAVMMPKSVYTFFSLLDGTRTWQAALAELPESARDFDETHVRALFQYSALRAPRPGDIRGTEPKGSTYGIDALDFSGGRLSFDLDENEIDRPR